MKFKQVKGFILKELPSSDLRSHSLHLRQQYCNTSHFNLFCDAGGLLVGLPEDPPPSSLLPEPVLQYYVQQYQKSGFR